MKTNIQKTVPWWTEDLAIAKKRVNAFRRKYQRTKNDILRDQRQNEYHAENAQYQVKIKNAKIQSWKQYCNKASSTNPWNIVYKSAAGKINNRQIMSILGFKLSLCFICNAFSFGYLPVVRVLKAFSTRTPGRHPKENALQIMSTLQKTNGSHTEDLRETIKCIIEHLIPKDEEAEETDYHKRIRTLMKEPVKTEDDRDFTAEEIKQTIKSIDHEKAPGEDGITSKILLWTFERFPRLVTTLFNGCLRTGCFPRRWKRARIIPTTKEGKENCNDAYKYRPISLLNVGGKVLEKLLINRIMHFLYSNELLNQNQFGFTTQKALQTQLWQ